MRFVYHITPYLTSLSAPFVSTKLFLCVCSLGQVPFCKEL
uniref:Uncharacterized protein n=1 Tax=Anguilla anguilla TaxID=7936 RepID=A0A0E9PQM9_ANGAN